MPPSRATAVLLLQWLLLTPGSTKFDVDVPDVDSYTIDVKGLRNGETSKSEVLKLLGKPAYVFSDVLGTEWWYPIRTKLHPIVPAPVLKVWFDTAGRVSDWAFFHLQTGRRLRILESAEETKRWYASMCDPPTWMEIDGIIKKGVTTREELTAAFQWWKLFGRGEKETPTYFKKVTQPIRVEEDGVDTMILYVDRPSPAYVPPFYLRLIFSGEVLRIWSFEGYGGCK